jgi:hypothetical protein
VFGVFWHPAELQLSSVHGFVSSQSTGVFTHPVAGSQLSDVQALASSQLGGVIPVQTPSEHMSVVVHALPSSQGLEFGTLLHVPSGSQLSSVHTLPS